MACQRGFTLVEIIVVILVVGILGALGAQFITQPAESYVAQTRRAQLVDSAEMALRRMQRDIRLALPNSLRVDASNHYLEMLMTSDGGRYRAESGGAGTDILDFSTSDNSFDVLGSLRSVPATGSGVAIYNLTASGSSGNAYQSPADNMSQVGAGSTATHMILNPPFTFPRPSPYQRFFIVQGPVSYACEAGELRRYSSYTSSAVQATPPGGGSDLVTDFVDVTGCEFRYTPGVSQRAGLMTLRLTLTDAGETVTLLHQVHVVNAP